MYVVVSCGLSFDERMRSRTQEQPVHNNPVRLLAVQADERSVQMHEHIAVCVDLELFLVGKPFLYW
jgi:hypothetical protein